MVKVDRVLALGAALVLRHVPEAYCPGSVLSWLPQWLPGLRHSRSTCALTWSGWPDSNRRPPAPKAGALTKLRHIPWNRTVAYPPTGQAPRRRASPRGVHRDGHSVKPVRCRCSPGAGNTAYQGTRGRSSMAEPQPSKLVMRVRFPSPAPTCNPRSDGTRTVAAILWRSVSTASRAIHVPLS